jgi:hypothetical protein
MVDIHEQIKVYGGGVYTICDWLGQSILYIVDIHVQVEMYGEIKVLHRSLGEKKL